MILFKSYIIGQLNCTNKHNIVSLPKIKQPIDDDAETVSQTCEQK